MDALDLGRPAAQRPWLFQLVRARDLMTAWICARESLRLFLPILVIHFLLMIPILFPVIYRISTADVVTMYMNPGRLFVNGLSEGRLDFIPFSNGPLLSYLYAAFYVPVHKSVSWVILGEWSARLLIFLLLWLSGYLIARQLPMLSGRWIFLAFLFAMPVIPKILGNSSDALFASLSGFAFWQVLAFGSHGRARQLGAASAFIGLAALTRFDGLLLFTCFLVVVAVNLVIPSPRLSPRSMIAAIAAASVPFILIVGSYVLIQGVSTGTIGIDARYRTYLAFEMNEGMSYSTDLDSPIRGIEDSRRMYGTPEENDFSVLQAIRRNPEAFVRRIAAAGSQMPPRFVREYGGPLAVFVLVLAGVGAFRLIVERSQFVAILVAGWLFPLLVYLVFCCREGYLFLSYFTLVTLASLGTEILLKELRRVLPPRVAALSRLKRLELVGILVLVGGSLILYNPFPAPERPVLGATAEEKAAAYMATNFERGTLVGSYLPAVVWMAKMNWQPMYADVVGSRLERLDVATEEQLMDWLRRTGVQAIYMDASLKYILPATYDVIQGEIGRTATEVFSPADIGLQYSAEVAELYGWYRIVRFERLDRNPGSG